MREKKKKESHNPSTSSYLPNTNVCAYECGLMHIINSLNTKKKNNNDKKTFNAEVFHDECSSCNAVLKNLFTVQK